MGEDFEVRTYRSADAPAALGLLEAAFGDWPGRRVAAHGRPGELFAWKHERNPHGASQIFLAEAGGRPIGMRAYMPWPLDVDGRRVDAVQTVDIATLPGRRGGGVSSELADHAIAALRRTKQFALGLPNDSSLSISSKSGWQAAGRLPVWVRVRRPLRVVRRLGALRSAGRSLAVPSVEAPLAGDALADGDTVAELLHQPRPSGPHLATLTGVDYLRWRYEPLLGDYRAVTEYSGGTLAGLAIFGLRQRGDLWEGSVCGCWCARATAARPRASFARSPALRRSTTWPPCPRPAPDRLGCCAARASSPRRPAAGRWASPSTPTRSGPTRAGATRGRSRSATSSASSSAERPRPGASPPPGRLRSSAARSAAPR